MDWPLSHSGTIVPLCRFPIKINLCNQNEADVWDGRLGVLAVLNNLSKHVSEWLRGMPKHLPPGSYDDHPKLAGKGACGQYIAPQGSFSAGRRFSVAPGTLRRRLMFSSNCIEKFCREPWGESGGEPHVESLAQHLHLRPTWSPTTSKIR